MRHVFIAAAMLATSLGTAFAQDAAKGEQVFSLCRPCHPVGPDAVDMLGPPLNGLDGRKAGSLPDFTYSAAMIAAGKTGTPASKGPVVWNEATFTQYIADPAAMIPNINMMFAGISGPDRIRKSRTCGLTSASSTPTATRRNSGSCAASRLIWLKSRGV